MITFKGKLTPTPRGGGGCYVLVPRDVATKLDLKGMPKVQAIIASFPYRGSLMPMGDGTYSLGVGKEIRKASGLAKVLARDDKARAVWEKLSYTNRKEAARVLNEAKRPETRARRLAKIVERLRSR